MPLVLDIFGVILMPQGLNTPLLDLCAAWRRDGEKVFGASNMTAIHNKELWEQPGIRAAFDEIYCSGQLGASKPDPIFFKAVSEKINVRPDQLLFFDDSGVNVEAAGRLGWEAYAFTDNRDIQTIANGFFLRHRADRKLPSVFKEIEMEISWADETDEQPDA